jgi:hypothetical protein
VGGATPPPPKRPPRKGIYPKGGGCGGSEPESPPRAHAPARLRKGLSLQRSTRSTDRAKDQHFRLLTRWTVWTKNAAHPPLRSKGRVPMLAEAFRQLSFSREALRAPQRPAALPHPSGWCSWGQFNAQAREAIEGAGDGLELATAWGVVCANAAVVPEGLLIAVRGRLTDLDCMRPIVREEGRAEPSTHRDRFNGRCRSFGLASQ